MRWIHNVYRQTMLISRINVVYPTGIQLQRVLIYMYKLYYYVSLIYQISTPCAVVVGDNSNYTYPFFAENVATKSSSIITLWIVPSLVWKSSCCTKNEEYKTRGQNRVDIAHHNLLKSSNGWSMTEICHYLCKAQGFLDMS